MKKKNNLIWKKIYKLIFIQYENKNKSKNKSK